MWTRLAPWLVQTGEFPQVDVGDPLPLVGVRASCWSVRAAQAPDGVEALAGNDPDGEASSHSALTGTCVWADGPGVVVLRTGEFDVVAEVRSPGVELPEVGDRATVVASIEVMSLLDADAFGGPDVRRDWRVRGLRVERRALADAPDPSGSVGSSGLVEAGPIVRVDEINRMLRWADTSRREHATYLLDLWPDGA